MVLEGAQRPDPRWGPLPAARGGGWRGRLRGLAPPTPGQPQHRAMLLGSFGEVDFLSTVHPVSSITASQCQGWHRWAQVSEVSHLARLWRMGAQQNFGVCSSEDMAIQGSSHLCLRKPEHFRAPKAHEVVIAASSTLHTAIPLHRRRKYFSKTGEVQPHSPHAGILSRLEIASGHCEGAEREVKIEDSSDKSHSETG